MFLRNQNQWLDDPTMELMKLNEIFFIGFLLFLKWDKSDHDRTQSIKFRILMKKKFSDWRELARMLSACPNFRQFFLQRKIEDGDKVKGPAT